MSRPDVTVRRGEALYSGTPLGQKLPFTPGYAVIGEIEAVGRDVPELESGETPGNIVLVTPESF